MSNVDPTSIQRNDLRDPLLLQPSRSREKDRDSMERRPFRLISKNGDSLVRNIRVEHKAILYILDCFTTMLHLHWHWLILLFGIAYMISWLAFALVWWGLSAAKDDVGLSCTVDVHDFAAAFLLSIEIQTTIGFGDVHINSGCPGGLIILCLQSLAGILLDAIMMGVIFTKIARPRERGKTVIFSDNAAIALDREDNSFYLMCRVGDIRKSHILEAHIRASLYHKEEYWESTTEQSKISLKCEDLDVGYDSGKDRLFLLLPVILRHKIGIESPFYHMSPEDLKLAHIEVVINLEGTMEATGMITQKLVSYTPDEILWGYRFKPMVVVQDGAAQADFSILSDLLPDPGTPRMSPKEYWESQDAV